MPCSWLTGAYAWSLIPWLIPFGQQAHPGVKAVVEKWQVGQGEQAGTCIRQPLPNALPSPRLPSLEVAETPLMPSHESGASIEVVHVELSSPLCNENRSCPERGASCQSRG